MSKQPTLAALRKKLWPHVALFVKLSNQSGPGVCACYTCGKELVIGKRGLHAGHCFSKKTYPIHYYDVTANIKPQCYSCNYHHQGRPFCFITKMAKEHGEKMVGTMIALRNSKATYTREYYLKHIEVFKQANLRLLALKDWKEMKKKARGVYHACLQTTESNHEKTD